MMQNAFIPLVANSADTYEMRTSVSALFVNLKLYPFMEFQPKWAKILACPNISNKYSVNSLDGLVRDIADVHPQNLLNVM